MDFLKFIDVLKSLCDFCQEPFILDKTLGLQVKNYLRDKSLVNFGHHKLATEPFFIIIIARHEIKFTVFTVFIIQDET